jgi:hypothetical protein
MHFSPSAQSLFQASHSGTVGAGQPKNPQPVSSALLELSSVVSTDPDDVLVPGLGGSTPVGSSPDVDDELSAGSPLVPDAGNSVIEKQPVERPSATKHPHRMRTE